MITLKENQINTITYQKETDTPLVTGSYTDGYVYNVILIPTLQNDTGSASITYTTSSTEDNPRWETLSFNISSTSDYSNKQVKGLSGTTYDMEIWYGPISSGSDLYWGTTNTLWINTTSIWSEGGGQTYQTVTENSVLKYQDRVFISGSVSPIEKKYISSNENAVYTVYQG